MMIIGANSKAKGQFSFSVIRGGQELDCFSGPSKNMILDAFLNVVNSNSSYSFSDRVGNRLASSFRVGTGSTPVSATDTALVLPVILIPSTSVTTLNALAFHDAGTDEIVCTQTVRGEIEITEAQNLQEIAAYTSVDGTNTAANPILSRALITDGSGDPTSLTVQPGDVLVVNYDFETRMPRTISATYNIKGVDMLIEAQQQNPNPSSQRFPWDNTCLGTFYSSSGFNNNITRHTGSNFTFPGWGVLFNPSWTQTSDAITSRSRQFPIANARGARRRIGLQQANGTIRGLFIGESDAVKWIYKFTPAITKTIDDVIELESYMQLSRA